MKLLVNTVWDTRAVIEQINRPNPYVGMALCLLPMSLNGIRPHGRFLAVQHLDLEPWHGSSFQSFVRGRVPVGAALALGLFCQLITIPLFKEHKILIQVASRAGYTIKLLPALVISHSNGDLIVSAFSTVIRNSEDVQGGFVCGKKRLWAMLPHVMDGATVARSGECRKS
jgi:hypothetical protein